MKGKMEHATRKKLIGVTVIGTLGVLLSAFLTYAHYNTAGKFCFLNGACDLVNQSLYSELFGVPVSVWGFLSYLIFFTFSLALLFKINFEKLHMHFHKNNVLLYLFAFSVFTFGYSVHLIFTAWFILKAFCTLCVISFVFFTLIFSLMFSSLSSQNIKIVIKKKYLYLVAVLLILVIAGKIIMKPTYPEILTPKDILGNENAPVQIVEFSDLQCPACRGAYFVTKKLIKEFGDDISIEFYHFPLLGIHPYSFKAAEASECANDQGKFWDYIDSIYMNQKALTKDDMLKRAEEVGIDIDKFEACLESDAKREVVDADVFEAESRSLTATPTFFINGKKLDSWEYENFKKKIQEAMK